MALQPSIGESAAWVRAKGESQLITTYSYYHSEFIFDADGNIIESDPFTKQELSIFYEYGITDETTIGFAPSFQTITQQLGNRLRERDVTFVYSDIFSRHQLWEDNGVVLSLQPMLTIPGGYDEEKLPLLENRELKGEIRLLGGYSFQYPLPSISFLYPLDEDEEKSSEPHDIYPGQYHFVTSELAIRHLSESQSQQIRFDLGLGIRHQDGSLHLGQIFSSFAMGDSSVNSRFTSNSSDLIKTQISTVEPILDDVSLQVGAYQDVWGRNVGNGTAFFVALWYTF